MERMERMTDELMTNLAVSEELNVQGRRSAAPCRARGPPEATRASMRIYRTALSEEQKTMEEKREIK